MECVAERYCIKTKSHNNWIIDDKLQGVRFWIVKMKKRTMLRRLSNRSAEPVDVVIPRQFSSGLRIDFLEPIFVQGKFGKIVISNGIEISDRAFAYSNVNEIVWPDDCTTIPAFCFLESSVNQISNIDNVLNVSDNAFMYSGIKKITWPTLCTHIPFRCFFRCELTEIDNIFNVERIDSEAFFEAKLSSLNLLDTSINRLEEGSLSGLSEECNITPPYYVSQEEFEESMKMSDS